MKYLQRKFSVPAGSDKVSQEDWDQIFKKKVHRDKHGQPMECPACGASGCMGHAFSIMDIWFCGQCGAEFHNEDL